MAHDYAMERQKREALIQKLVADKNVVGMLELLLRTQTGTDKTGGVTLNKIKNIEERLGCRGPRVGVSQPSVSKYTRDDRWEFGGGPWTATEVKEIRAWRRRHYPADDDPLAELQDLSQERRAKLQLVVERTIAVKFKNQLAAGGLLDKHEVERGRVERVAAVKAAMMAIRHLAVKMEGKGLQEREQILEDWARGVCNRFAAPDPTDPPD